MGVPREGPMTNEPESLLLRVIFEGSKNDSKHQQGTPTRENFPMLNFDDFISNSSYTTTKIYKKNIVSKFETR